VSRAALRRGVTGHELVLEVSALVIGIALVLATGLALAAAAAGPLTTAQNCRDERAPASVAPHRSAVREPAFGGADSGFGSRDAIR
jgi:hypothetical protein